MTAPVSYHEVPAPDLIDLFHDPVILMERTVAGVRTRLLWDRTFGLEIETKVGDADPLSGLVPADEAMEAWAHPNVYVMHLERCLS